MLYRLILLVGPAGSGKTMALQDLATRTGASLINLNLALSERLLDVPPDRRPLRVAEICHGIITEAGTDVVLLDNTELLFSAPLRVNVLPLLQRLSRNHTLVASWRGGWDGRMLTYATPGHPEYRQYPAVDAVIVAAADPAPAPHATPLQ